MKRLLIVALVAVTWVPASALASSSCAVLRDPSGDAGGMADLYGISPQPVARESASAVDITRVDAGYDDDGVMVVGWRVAGFTDANADDTYSISWRYGTASVSITASRNPQGRWSYMRNVSREGTNGVNGPVAGDVDLVSGIVSVRLPVRDAAHVKPGARMNDVSAWSLRSEMVGVLYTGMWSDSTEVRDVRLRAGCAPPASATAMCSVLSDAAGDVGSSDGTQDSNVDIRSVAIGSTPETLTVRVFVRDLEASVPDGVDGQYWSVGWSTSRGSYGITAERWRDVAPTFSFSGPTGGDSATGSFDAAARTITVDVDREALAIPDRTPMTDVNAWSGSSAHTDLYTSSTQYDMAHEAGGARFTPGVPCGTDVPVCPPVVDVAGDAGPIYSANGADVPRNEPALDVRSLGAHSGSKLIRISTRVDDANASLSPGWDSAGWTMSWTRDETRRYFVQAVRGPNGVRFTYGVDSSNGAGYVSGPTFGGRRTSGSIDGNVISVDIPRRAIGDPSDGTTLERFGASTWVMRTGTSAATYRVLDQTDHGWYVVGSDCDP